MMESSYREVYNDVWILTNSHFFYSNKMFVCILDNIYLSPSWCHCQTCTVFEIILGAATPGISHFCFLFEHLSLHFFICCWSNCYCWTKTSHTKLAPKELMRFLVIIWSCAQRSHEVFIIFITRFLCLVHPPVIMSLNLWGNSDKTIAHKPLQTIDHELR